MPGTRQIKLFLAATMLCGSAVGVSIIMEWPVLTAISSAGAVLMLAFFCFSFGYVAGRDDASEEKKVDD